MSKVRESNEEELNYLKEKYEKLLIENPSSAAFVFLAEILIKRSQFDRATDILVEGLRRNPDNVTAKFLLGKIHLDRGMISQAKKEMEEVLQFAPDNVAASKILIQIYRDEGEPHKALGVAQSISFYIPGDDELKSVIEELEREISLAEERELTDESGSIDDQDSEEPFPGLLQAEIYTETMADLYMSQGFYADAAGVYEKLLERDRANDSLERKLERAKSYLLSEKAGFVGKK